MKIFHISSFVGNLGDVLSNAALHGFLSSFYDVKIRECEIRKFYKNYLSSEKVLLIDEIRNAAKRNEVVLIGGGGFFDYWVEGSASGTTIDLDWKDLEGLDTKIIFSSIGSYPHVNVPDGNKEKFSEFLSGITSLDNVSIMLRNDGSYENLSTFVDPDVLSRVCRGGDHAYLYDLGLASIEKTKGRYILVNLAPDQLLMNSSRHAAIDVDLFYDSIALGIQELCLKYECDVLFVPHLVVDYRAYMEVCRRLPDLFVRTKVRIYSYDGTSTGLSGLVACYNNSLMNLCMRLHSNILSILLNKNTVSIAALDRVSSIADQHCCCTKLSEFGAGLIEGMTSLSIDGAVLDSSAIAIKNIVAEFLSEKLLSGSASSCNR